MEYKNSNRGISTQTAYSLTRRAKGIHIYIYISETEENDLESRDLQLSLDRRNPTRLRGGERKPGGL